MADFEIGTTLEGMTNLEALTTPIEAPKSSYLPYARIYNTGSGGARGVGSPVAQWMFPLLSIEQYNQLKTFCAGTSAHVFIHTKLDNDSYADFEGELVRPNEPQNRWFGERRDFTILFRNLILTPEGS